jgi:hypothetical protein
MSDDLKETIAAMSVKSALYILWGGFAAFVLANTAEVLPPYVIELSNGEIIKHYVKFDKSYKDVLSYIMLGGGFIASGGSAIKGLDIVLNFLGVYKLKIPKIQLRKNGVSEEHKPKA